jgi:hypothetical protein
MAQLQLDVHGTRGIIVGLHLKACGEGDNGG